MKRIFLIISTLCLLNQVKGQETFSTLKLTYYMDQLKFETPGQNRYWIMSKTQTDNKAFALYSPEEGWFTYWKEGSGDMIVSKGSLGIGISPTDRLHIGSGEGYGLTIGKPDDDFGLNGGSYDIKFYGYRDVKPNAISAKISAVRTNTYSNWLHQGTDLVFSTTHLINTSDADNSIERMRITGDGKVSIGTSNPTGKLSVTNTGTIGDGNFANSFVYVTDGTQKMGIDPNQIYAGQDLNVDATTHMRFVTAGTERLRILQNGNVGIGTSTTGTHKLAVDGTIGAQEIKVEATSWPDFVFKNDYKLRALEEVENYISKNKHLPEIPSEAEVDEHGINLGEMNAKLLQKIEELTLYLIEQNKQNQAQQARIEQLEQELDALQIKDHGNR